MVARILVVEDDENVAFVLSTARRLADFDVVHARSGRETLPEVAQSRPPAMGRIGQESARLARLVEDRLLLARLDEGGPLERTPIDLVPLVQDVVLDVSATHPWRTVTFDLPS